MTFRRALVRTSLWLPILLVALPASAQKRLTIDALYDPATRLDVGRPGPSPYSRVTWLDDTHYLWPREIAGGSGRYRLVKIAARTGAETPLFDPSLLARAIAAVPGVGEGEAERLARQRSYTFNHDHSALLVSIADDLYFWRLGADRLARLSSSPGDEEFPAFSPDGRLVVYVRGFDLFVSDPQGGERPLTTGGGPQLLNGKLDWIYQEEVYGRGTFRAFWWSPDSTRLAFLQLDETRVPEFAVVDHVDEPQVVEETDYPRPGDPNPSVRLGLVRAAGGPVKWVGLEKYSPDDLLIVNVGWTPDGRQAMYHAQNREQTWLDLNLADAGTGETRTLFRETTPAFVSEIGAARWLADGTFLWLSERDGWQHLYRYKRDGTLVARITSGEWEVDSLLGVDESKGVVYFSGTERSHIGRDIDRVRLDGGGLTRLSQKPGTHGAVFNPAFSLYVGTWSDITTPPQARLHGADGSEVRVLDENRIPALADYGLSAPEFLQVPTRDGFMMEALIIKPPDFDPARKYPVVQQTYAGPHAPQVRNAWRGVPGLYQHLLAQHGIVVWVCDNRSASGKGAISAWHAYKRLGVSELADIEDGVAWLKQQPWVDGSRIGIEGWSYGGFMTSYALTHSTSFAMGIAGGSVTDWRDYDSIYTERFMLRPQHNPDGYRVTSARLAAKDLSGHLLLVHGTMDDNVHVQNTLRFAYELQRAGKRFEMMLYPRSRHGVTDPLLLKHMRQTMLDFTLRTLRPDTAVREFAPPPTAGASGAHE